MEPHNKTKTEEPLLSGYQYLGRENSVKPMGGIEISPDDIRYAAANSDHFYPPFLYAPLLDSPDPVEAENLTAKHVLHFRRKIEIGLQQAGSKWPKQVNHVSSDEQGTVYQGPQGGYRGQYGGVSIDYGRQVLDEVEIRELLIDHVGHRCCWGSRPARTWKIQAVEDCNAYVGTLETFIEERETIRDIQPCLGGTIDGKENGTELGVWELDLRSEFPLLFVPYKLTRVKVPHSETIEKCSGCEGRGDNLCPACNAEQEPGYYKENQMLQCPSCYGRGLIAHRDGSDTICVKCDGKGKIPCGTCGSRGLIKCQECKGSGSLLARNIAVVKWKTLSHRKVSASSGAASVPDEVFHRAKGVQLCNTQAYQCTPAYFADSYFLNKFSSEVIAERPSVPPTARVICERHTVSVVPVTRVTMSNHGRSFIFYIIGFSREVYLKDYYPAKFCWGLCPCLEWLNL